MVIEWNWNLQCNNQTVECIISNMLNTMDRSLGNDGKIHAILDVPAFIMMDDVHANPSFKAWKKHSKECGHEKAFPGDLNGMSKQVGGLPIFLPLVKTANGTTSVCCYAAVIRTKRIDDGIFILGLENLAGSILAFLFDLGIDVGIVDKDDNNEFFMKGEEIIAMMMKEDKDLRVGGTGNPLTSEQKQTVDKTVKRISKAPDT